MNSAGRGTPPNPRGGWYPPPSRPRPVEGGLKARSTRGAIALIRGAQACALLNDRDYVLPEDVQRMVLPVLTHRIMPNPDAKMKGISAERILIAVVENVPVPLRLS